MNGYLVNLIIYTQILLPIKRYYSSSWVFLEQSSVFWLWLTGISKGVALPRNILSALPMDFLVGTALQQEMNPEAAVLLAAVE